jgi:hypothetical protein
MPLTHSHSLEAFKANLKTELAAKKPIKQALAIAYSEQRRVPHANGGMGDRRINSAIRIARDIGGSVPAVPFFERAEARDISPYGFTAGFGGGRTDKNNVAVGSGSYVLPADVVAGLGDGNSLAGAKTWDMILNTMPYGISPPHSSGHRGPPAPPHDPELMQGMMEGTKAAPISPALAAGGVAEKEEVPIQSADGEIIVPPEDILRIGQHYSSPKDVAAYPTTHEKMMKLGHEILDRFVKEQRGRVIKHLKSLRGPVGSANSSVGHT